MFAIIFLLGIVGTAFLYLRWVVKMMWTKTEDVPKKTCKESNKVVVYIWLSSMRRKSADFTFGHVSLELLKYEYNEKTRCLECIRGRYSDNTYISFGPEDYPPTPITVFKEQRSKTIENYRDDLVYQERGPDLLFYFHSLEVNSMISRIKDIKEAKIKYGLFGSITIGCETDSKLKILSSWTRRLVTIIAIFVNNWLLVIPIVKVICFRLLPSATKVKSHSCVSVVFDIFHAGLGVSKLLGFSDELVTAIFSSREASKASLESSKEEEIQKCLSKVFRSFGYLTEASVSPIIISPDIFADFMKQAKCNETKFYNIPSERKTFIEENVEMKKEVKLRIEMEEWLPSYGEQSNIGRNFVLVAFPTIWMIGVALILEKILV